VAVACVVATWGRLVVTMFKIPEHFVSTVLRWSWRPHFHLIQGGEFDLIPTPPW
jgi:hypothetical protein